MYKLRLLFFLISTTSLFSTAVAYVTNFDDDTVTVINRDSNTAIATIPVGNGPKGIAVTPDEKFVYVANAGGTISVIDTSSNAVTTTITIGSDLIWIAITPDGTKAYVTCCEAGPSSVYPITLASNAVGTAISVDTNPQGIAFSNDGTFAIVSSFAAGTFTRITTATNVADAPIAIGTAPTGVAIAGDDLAAYFADNSANTIIERDLFSNTTSSAAVGTSPLRVEVLPPGFFIYITNNGSDTVFVMEAASLGFDTSITGLSSPTDIAITSDKKHALVANSGNNTVSIIQISDNSITGSVPVGANPQGIALADNVTITTVIMPVSGVCRKNIFLAETEITNTISWAAPNTTPAPTSYNFYRNGALVRTYSANESLQFVEHNSNQITTYRVDALNSSNSVILSESLTINACK